ncbi:MAG: TrkA family potassium uptake protein [Bacteroidales bacterium]|nr:TrkA family potassium uptake protein [Bacteroidales bacterium]
MKYIIIGLGNFGSSLAQKLTRTGHEIIGVDKNLDKVKAHKEKITHAICMDCSDQQAAKRLPLKDTDIVIVCIGEDEGANLMVTALMKQNKVKRLISRAISPLHETILEAMGIIEIIHPEEETAERWTKKLTMKGIVDSFSLDPEYSIIEAKVPEKFTGQKLAQINTIRNYGVLILTTIKIIETHNILGASRNITKVQGVASSETVLEADDILVMYGKIKDIERFLKGG